MSSRRIVNRWKKLPFQALQILLSVQVKKIKKNPVKITLGDEVMTLETLRSLYAWAVFYSPLSSAIAEI
jgi:hypothetical protein